MPWLRETSWRQGKLLPRESLHELSAVALEENADMAIAISHDCDITNDNIEAEPSVEFVLVKTIETIDGHKEHGKNPRQLHIKATSGSDATVALELKATQKITINKIDLARHEPDNAIALDSQNVDILRDWLAARYKRQALPDSLNERLRPVTNFISKRVKNITGVILGFWIDYRPRDEELPPDQPYELMMYIIYTIHDPSLGKLAIQLAKDLRDNFESLMKKTGKAGTIDLRECEAISEEEFTIRDARFNLHYRFEYMSFRTDPAGPTT